jgi:hypothetical protein
MPSTNDPQDHRGLFALFKSESGMGKSTAALSFPTPYVFDHDEKMPAVSKKHFPDKEVHWDTFKDVFEVGEKLKSFVIDGCPYETIIADSVTSLSYLCLKTMDDIKGTNILKMMQSIVQTKGGKQQSELRGFDYYNAEDNFIKYYLDMLKILWKQPGNPKHVILLAHILSSEQVNAMTGAVTKTRRIVTAGTKIAAYIPAQFDNVFLFGRQDPEFGSDDQTKRRICITQAIGDDDAKCVYRFPSQIDFTDRSLYDELCKYDDLSAPKVIDRIDGAIAAAEAKW